MVNPVKAIGRVFDPLITATQRAFTPPGHGGTTPEIPAPPPAAPPAETPTPKPKRKGQQESFLSGVAATGLTGATGGTTGGKTLLGA